MCPGFEVSNLFVEVYPRVELSDLGVLDREQYMSNGVKDSDLFSGK